MKSCPFSDRPRGLGHANRLWHSVSMDSALCHKLFGSFRKLGVPFLGVLIIGSYYLGYYIRVPYPFRRIIQPLSDPASHLSPEHAWMRFHVLGFLV